MNDEVRNPKRRRTTRPSPQRTQRHGPSEVEGTQRKTEMGERQRHVRDNEMFQLMPAVDACRRKFPGGFNAEIAENAEKGGNRGKRRDGKRHSSPGRVAQATFNAAQRAPFLTWGERPASPTAATPRRAEVAEKDGNRAKADPFDSAMPRSGQAAHRSEGGIRHFGLRILRLRSGQVSDFGMGKTSDGVT
jgi:hypothetical protein